ncbi:MAG: hypothetical protein ACLQFR_27660 [Streptosporangiaceae bacterium]
MKRILRQSLTPAFAISALALAIAFGGGTALGQSLISTGQLANSSVTTPKLADHSVTAAKLAGPGKYYYVGTKSVPFLNGWTNYFKSAGYARVRYYKDVVGVVHLEGVMYGGGGNNFAFRLPSGFRPQVNHAFIVAASTGSSFDDVDVYANGNVFINGTGDPCSLDGISFRTR